MPNKSVDHASAIIPASGSAGTVQRYKAHKRIFDDNINMNDKMYRGKCWWLLENEGF